MSGRTDVSLSEARALFERDGFVLMPGGVSDGWLTELRRLTETIDHSEGRRRGGVRSVFESVPGLLGAVRACGVGGLIGRFFEREPFVVRAILFDKTPESNWGVSWHRDETVCVRERHDVAGYGPWSVKAGVDHVRPPRVVLDRMVTARIHLDDAGADNGALRLIPGSHRTDADRGDEDGVVSEARAGDVLFMRPRTLHASEKQRAGTRRRVLHVECADFELDEKLAWGERVAFEGGATDKTG